MKKVRITVIRTMINKDLAEQYGVDGLGTCPILKEGQEFLADWAKPEGFCDEAWKAIYQYVFALAHGVQGPLYYNDWIKTPGVAICSCNDGLRPVIFKLEATDIESKPERSPLHDCIYGFGPCSIALPHLPDYIEGGYEHGDENERRSDISDVSDIPRVGHKAADYRSHGDPDVEYP